VIVVAVLLQHPLIVLVVLVLLPLAEKDYVVATASISLMMARSTDVRNQIMRESVNACSKIASEIKSALCVRIGKENDERRTEKGSDEKRNERRKRFKTCALIRRKNGSKSSRNQVPTLVMIPQRHKVLPIPYHLVVCC
jgi:hypothetical protein